MLHGKLGCVCVVCAPSEDPGQRKKRARVGTGIADTQLINAHSCGCCGVGSCQAAGATRAPSRVRVELPGRAAAPGLPTAPAAAWPRRAGAAPRSSCFMPRPLLLPGLASSLQGGHEREALLLALLVDEGLVLQGGAGVGGGPGFGSCQAGHRCNDDGHRPGAQGSVALPRPQVRQTAARHHDAATAGQRDAAATRLGASPASPPTHDVGDDAAARDGGLDQRVQLLITADSKLEMAGGDTLHLEILGGVASQLQHLQTQARRA